MSHRQTTPQDNGQHTPKSPLKRGVSWTPLLRGDLGVCCFFRSFNFPLISALLFVVLLLLATSLRLYGLDGQSLWSDEGNSVAMVPRAPLEIIERTANDIHPPLYYLTLSAWSSVFGTSVIAVRGLSVLFGVLTVGLTMRLGLQIGVRVAFFAGLAAALSPFAIHYSQETRMYMMVTMLAAASWLLWLRYMEHGGVDISPAKSGRGERQRQHTPKSPLKRGHTPKSPLKRGVQESPLLRGDLGVSDLRWMICLPYFLLILALLHTHYYAVSVVVAQNLAWLWYTVRGGRWERGWWGRWVGIQVAIVAAYLPWLWYARETILNWPSISSDITLGFIGREVFRIFSLGLANDGMTWGAAIGFGLLFGMGLLARHGMVWFYFAVPPLLMLLLSLDRPFWNPKFLLLALPAYHLLLGLGAAALMGWLEKWHRGLAMGLGVAIGGFLLWAAVEPLSNEYWEPRFWRDDYRAMARLIEAQASEHDAILLDGAGQREVFEYYFDCVLPCYGLPATQPLEESVTKAQLEQMAAQHERLFVLWWAEEQGDPQLFIPRWLDDHAFEAGSRWFGDVRLATYRLAELPPPEALDLSFSPPSVAPNSGKEDGQELTEAMALRLEGASLEPQTVIAGNVIALNSFWASSATGLALPVTFFAQLLDGGNHVVGQYDGDGGAAPLPEWEAGAAQRVRMGIPVAVGTPPGEYRLILGAYRADNGQRFMIRERNADAFQLAIVDVEAPIVPPTVDALGLAHDEVRQISFGEITLVGARANKLGFDHMPESPLAAGEPLALLLYWRAEEDAPNHLALMLRLYAKEGTLAAEWPFEPTETRHPLPHWSKEELVRDPQVRFLPNDMAVGDYRLMLEGDGGEALVGEVRVR